MKEGLVPHYEDLAHFERVVGETQLSGDLYLRRDGSDFTIDVMVDERMTASGLRIKVINSQAIYERPVV